MRQARIKPGLIAIALIASALLAGASATGIPGAAPVAAPSPCPADFLQHLHRNSPSGLGACIVTQVRARWPNRAAVDADAEKVRAVRGQADGVNYAIRMVREQCTSTQH